MQTEEETAAAEEPILEEGSEREQVNEMTFHVYPLSPRKVAQIFLHLLQEPPGYSQ